MRRYNAGLRGERYLVDTRNQLIHDLDNEQASCAINALINSGQYEAYVSILQAIFDKNYQGHVCTGKFTRTL